METRPGGQLSAHLGGALALPAAAFPPGQEERAGTSLPTAAGLLVMGVEASTRRRAGEAGRWTAAAKTASSSSGCSSSSSTVLVSGRWGTDRALQGGGATWGGARAAVVVRRAGQAAHAHPGAPVLGRVSVMERGATRSVHQLSKAWQKVWVTGAAGSNPVTPEPEKQRVMSMKNNKRKMRQHRENDDEWWHHQQM